MPLDPLIWNRDNLSPTADKPLLFIFRGHIPSLKNDRDIGIGKNGKLFNRPKPEVGKTIALIRDTLDRFLPEAWEPIKVPQIVCLWMVVGAHGLTTIPDADADNMGQTVQEALAAPRKKGVMTAAQRRRLIAEDDRQVVSLHPFRRTFANKDRIYHELYVWGSQANNNPFQDIEEYGRVARLREEALSDAASN